MAVRTILQTKKIPSTAEDPAAIRTAARLQQDAEKGEVGQVDRGGSPIEAPSHITPELERRVLRKLDTRLVPLVMVLCTSPSLPPLTSRCRRRVDLLAYLDRSNIGYASARYSVTPG
jgi:hypothetical protein